MLILGLTGSIAMGKSTAAAMFRRLGVRVFDADLSVHHQLATNREAIAAIAAAFPGTVRDGQHDAGGQIDRAALARAVFRDDACLDRLESILHPLVDRAQKRFLRIAARHRSPLVVLDIPLLFETGRERDCDCVAVVSAPGFVQEQRLRARPGMDRQRMEKTLARQMPDAEKRRRADYIIPTGLSRGETMRVITRLVAELPARPARSCRHSRRNSTAPSQTRRPRAGRRDGLTGLAGPAS
jgi:dephospho-CoA kinase